MPPLSEEERKLLFARDQHEGASVEKFWPGEPRTLKVPHAQKQPVLNCYFLSQL